MLEQDKEYIVQSNALVEARYTLPLLEQRLLMLLIGKIDTKADDFSEIRLDIREALDRTRSDKDKSYTHQRKTALSLLTRTVHIKHDNGEEYFSHWIQSIKVTKSHIFVRFDPELKDELLQLKRCFTVANTNVCLALKGRYSARIYLLLKQYVKIGKRRITIEELAQMLELPKSYTDRISNIKTMLTKAHEEITTHTDLNFTLEYEYEGREIIAINCKNIKENSDAIKEKEAQKIAVPNLNSYEKLAYSRLTNNKWGVTQKAALKAIAEFGAKRVLANLDYCHKHRQGKHNLGGFVLTAIVQDYAADEAQRLAIQRKEEEHERQKELAKEESKYLPIIGSDIVKDKLDPTRPLTELEIELIKEGKGKLSKYFKTRLERLGLNYDDIASGKYESTAA